MMYKNSMKLLFSNFNIVWKVLLYVIVMFLIVFGLAYATALPVFNVLVNSGFVESVKSLFETFINNLNGVDLFRGIGELSIHFVDTIFANFHSIGIYIILFIFEIFVFGRFLMGLTHLTISEMLYSSMSSNLKVGFLYTLFTNFRKIILLELSKFIITFPLDMLIGYVIIMCFKLFAIKGIVAFLTPFIIVLVSVVLISFRVALFSCWVPMIAVKNGNIFVSLVKSFKLQQRRFFKILGNSVGLVLTILIINVFATLFTLGVGVILTIPLSYVWLDTFQMVSYYGSYGMRYYVDSSTIIEPRKMNETDTVKSAKYVI